MRMLTRYAQEIYGEAWEYEEFRDLLTCVDITPVAKWFYRDNDQQHYQVHKDFPRVAPPWPQTWIEFVPPNEVNKGGEISQMPVREMGIKRIGAHIGGAEIGEELEGHRHPMLEMLRSFGQFSGSRPDNVLEKITANENARWWMACRYYMAGRNNIDVVGASFDFLDGDGRIIQPDERLVAPMDKLAEAVQFGEMSEEQSGHFLNALSFPFFFAISLCHCNNVDIGEDSVHETVRQNRKSKGQNPGQTFKTLEIEPMKEKSASSSSGGQSSVNRALHICRGHFKTYTEDAPLFGEHTGTYWWPIHTRGSAESGEVKKDYRVNEPNP